MATKVYSVPGISCGHCKASIEGGVSKVPGVGGVEVSIDEKQVTVDLGSADESAILEAIDEAGYEVAGEAAHP